MPMWKQKNKIQQNKKDIAFDIATHLLLFLVLIVIVYPLYFVLVASFSDPQYVNSGKMLFFPQGFTTMGYERVFSDERLLTSYMNTILYTLGGTGLGVFCSVLSGYALSRKDLPFRGVIMAMLIVTMYFSGGLIPTYLLVGNLHLLNTRAIIILLGSISVYNIILIRSFFTTMMPESLYEAAQLDGCGNTRFFFAIAHPLSKAIVAVIALYIAVNSWNSYFNPMIYLTDVNKYPLPILLREILITAKPSDTNAIVDDPAAAAKAATLVEVVKYGIIVVTTLPILCVYPFLQKYFVKGVMIGSIKG
ncbi:MAG: carbohydrate ABC transporter permease [Eubacteriales bacterium]